MRKLSEKLTDEEKQTKRDKNRERMKKSRIEKYYDKNDFDKESSSDDSGDDEDHSSDIVKKINEKHRENNENKFLLIEKRSETGLEECTCDIDIDCPYCTAQHEAEKGCYTIDSKEEKERFAKEEQEEYKNMLKMEKKRKGKLWRKILRSLCHHNL